LNTKSGRNIIKHVGGLITCHDGNNTA